MIGRLKALVSFILRNNVPLQSGPPDESNFDVTVTGGNACVGVRPVINVAPGTPG